MFPFNPRNNCAFIPVYRKILLRSLILAYPAADGIIKFCNTGRKRGIKII